VLTEFRGHPNPKVWAESEISSDLDPDTAKKIKLIPKNQRLNKRKQTKQNVPVCVFIGPEYI
jgi:hypothetical protein